MSHIKISKKILEWALHRRGIQTSSIKKQIPKIDSWIEGKVFPTLKQLEKFSKLTNTPLGFLFLDVPPVEKLPIPYFRTVNDKSPPSPSPELIETVQQMQRRQNWIRDYLIEEGESPLSFVGSMKINIKPKIAAQEIRKFLKIDSNWAADQSTWSEALSSLRTLIEDLGIILSINGIVGNSTNRKLSVEEFRGFVLVDDYAPLIFINGADGKAAQMFTLMHEVAHVFLGKSAVFDLKDLEASDDPSEKLCNEIAAEILIPEEEFHSFWLKIKSNPDPFQMIARNFKVSAVVAARRGLDLGVISRQYFFEYYRKILNSEKRILAKSSGGDFYASQNLRVGKRFGNTVIKALHEGKLFYNEAYRLTGLYGKSFEQFSYMNRSKAKK